MGSKWSGNAKRKNGGMLDRRDHRREQIAEMLLRGESYRTIGNAVGLSVTHVSREIADIRNQWHEQTKKHGDQIMSQLLQQLDLIKRESLQEWERSKQPKVRIVKKYCELLDGPGIAPSATGGIGGVGGISGGLPNITNPLASGEEVSNQDSDFNRDSDSDQDSSRVHPENPFSHTDEWASFDESGYKNPFGDEPVDDEASGETSGEANGDSNSSGKSNKPKKQKPGKSDNLLLAAEVTQTVEERLGDPRYLVVAQSCIEKQANMLGLNITKVALTDPTGQQTYAAGAVQDLMVLAEEVAQGPLVFDDSIIELEANKYLIENAGVGGGEPGLNAGVSASGEEGSVESASGEKSLGGGDDDDGGEIDNLTSSEIPYFPLAITPIVPTHPDITAKKPTSFSLFDSPPPQG